MQSDTYRDVAYAIRILRKHPFSSFAVVLTLAIAIGANTAVFSIVNFLIFRPLPIKEPSQIYVLAFRQNQALGSQTSIPNFLDIQRSSRDVFQYLIGYKLGIDGLSVDGRADRITTSFVTGDYFVALGIKPELGRFVLPSEGTISGADPIVVLSYSYWRTRFRGDPQVIGQRVLVNGHPFTIVGVGPKGFHGLHPLLDTQAFLPLAMATIEGQSPDFMNNRVTRSLTVIGRLESGVTARKAQSELDAISSRLAGQFPESDATLEILSYPEASARPEPSSSRGLAIVSILFLTLTASVLVLACVNIASLVVIQMNARRFEFAVRTSFGASRSRLIRQIFTEILLLSLIGGSVGVVLGTGICRFLGRINLRTDVLFTIDFSLDWRVFAFSLAMTMLMAMLVGLLPALRIPAGDLSQILHDGNLTAPPSRQRIRKVLVVFQIASALSLLIIGALLARSLYHAQRMKLGFDPRGLLNISMDSNEVGYGESRTRELYRELLTRIRSMATVESASLSTSVPMGYYQNSAAVQIAGYVPNGSTMPLIGFSCISSDYFRTLSIPIMAGRDFNSLDNADTQPVAIISQEMAREFWPSKDPLGLSFRISDDSPDIVVVGIVGDSRHVNLVGPIRAYFYLPLDQDYASLVTLQIRSPLPPETLVASAERDILAIAPGLPLFDVQTMSQALNTLDGLLIFELGAGLASGLGILGLILAVVGVYGVVSHSVSQQTREIGLRLALGAHPSDIHKMVAEAALILVGIGFAAGFGFAYLIAHFMRGLLIATEPSDRLAYLGAAAVLALAALPACYLPAHRAISTDPAVALRHE